MFLDLVTLCIKAGRGGSGKISHEKMKKSIGKPNGGSGGNGGDVYLEYKKDLSSLNIFAGILYVKGKDGANGDVNLQKGKNGEDISIFAPMGTEVYHNNILIGELTQETPKILLCKGGNRGMGNGVYYKLFKTSNYDPILPTDGEEKEIVLNLKSICHIALVGFPNVGKSSFLRKFTGSKTPIGDYKFTTLHPYLGVLKLEHQSITIADIPGLIPGSSQGKGKGIEFLKHIEKSISLIFFLSNEDPINQYKILIEEVGNYNKALLEKNNLILINKCELITSEQKKDIHNFFKKINMKFSFISLYEKIGFNSFKKLIMSIL